MFWGGVELLDHPVGVPFPRLRLRMSGWALACCCCKAAVRALMRALSMLRVMSGGKTGRVSKEPGAGCFHVLSISSSFLRVFPSTRV